jgi:hypothetical protein
MPNERIFEELPLGHKVEQRTERKADDRDIHPILMLRENDRRPVIRKSFLPLDLKVIKDGEDHLGNPPGKLVDDRAPSHPEPHNVKCQNPKFKSMSNFKC